MLFFDVFFILLANKDLDTSNGCNNFKIKCKLRLAYSIYIQRHPVLLGGLGATVEVDESVICRRGTIRNPKSIDDNTADTVWIFGAIDNTPEKKIILQLYQIEDCPH